MTLATYTLICMMVKHGTIEQKQVIDIVRHYSSSPSTPFCDSTPTPAPHEKSKMAEHTEANGSRGSLPHLGLYENRLLYAGIQSRLAALRDRIHASGKAVLRPSNAIMGPPFAPALAFLRGVVRDVAASASPAEDAAARKHLRDDEP